MYAFFNYILFVFDTIAHYIAPKKAKKVKTEKLKKVMSSHACNPCGHVFSVDGRFLICMVLQQLQKQIGQRIEQEVTQTASRGGTEFRVLTAPTPSTSSELGAKGKGKGKGKGKEKGKQ